MKSNKNFKRAYSKGSSFAGFLVVLYLYPNELKENRVGYSVTKNLGKAVVRNRIKRLFREAYRKHLNYLENGYDIIFVARRSVLKANIRDICVCFKDLFEKSGIYKC
ncbi:MAG TPA: ribonuclease P protein component [Candidatus Eremiobacteraeota bacterium]|nr:ribonuclease P protein component [Candidatus Eremiobacteraeota bacterium]